jgi:phosphotransferase system  glucose/maltose/N-acetylglucosamine-specific IIC component
MTSHGLNSRAGMIGGMLLSILPNLEFNDAFRTIVLAMIGTSVSFFMTLFLRWLTQFFNPRRIGRDKSKSKSKRK